MGEMMDILASLVGIGVGVVSAFVIGYRFGYQCGFDDARDGLPEQ
jgi:hypothetical protein